MRSKSAPFQDKLTLSVLANGTGLSSSNRLFTVNKNIIENSI